MAVILLLLVCCAADVIQTTTAFQFHRENVELIAPEMLCISGSNQNREPINQCPSTNEEVGAYDDGIWLDPNGGGAVKVVLRNIRMRDDGRRRNIYLMNDDNYRQVRGGGRGLRLDQEFFVTTVANSDAVVEQQSAEIIEAEEIEEEMSGVTSTIITASSSDNINNDDVEDDATAIKIRDKSVQRKRRNNAQERIDIVGKKMLTANTVAEQVERVSGARGYIGSTDDDTGDAETEGQGHSNHVEQQPKNSITEVANGNTKSEERYSVGRSEREKSRERRLDSESDNFEEDNRLNEEGDLSENFKNLDSRKTEGNPRRHGSEKGIQPQDGHGVFEGEKTESTEEKSIQSQESTDWKKESESDEMSEAESLALVDKKDNVEWHESNSEEPTVLLSQGQVQPVPQVPSKQTEEVRDKYDHKVTYPIPSGTIAPKVTKAMAQNSEPSTYKMDSNEQSLPLAHHIQIYLYPLSNPTNFEQMICCYELEFGPPFPTNVTTETVSGVERAKLPDECTLQDPHGMRAKSSKIDEKSIPDAFLKFAHDYRVGAPRIGKIQATSAQLKVNSFGGIDLIATLIPESAGRHMVVISNCAAEINGNSEKIAEHQPLKVTIGTIDINFTSKFGELPLSMMGIIPFYGVFTFLYGLLAIAWHKRSRVVTRGARIMIPLLGLQKAIFYLIILQFVFSTIAFIYYLHLNNTSVDIDVLYSGTAAALVTWGHGNFFLSIIVALAHFATVLGCQIVVTLATDGTWLIQHNIRPSTKTVLYGLCAAWILFFLIYSFIPRKAFRNIMIAFVCIWVMFLIINVRRSLRHLQSLMMGKGSETVMAAGGALVAKRSLYRKMCAIVSLYPIVFIVSVMWASKSQQDSWAWVGYVLVDVYLFVILLHASFTWMPRPMASQEYVKYAPLDMSIVPGNDNHFWDESIDDVWGEEEIELQTIG